MRSMARGWSRLGLVVVVVVTCGPGLLACGSKAVDEAMREIQARHSAPVDPFGTDAVAKGAQELERQLGGPVRVLEVEMSPQRIVYQVQDPKKPENVDAYELKNGVLMPPQPVQLMLMGEPLDPKLYALAEVPLDRIPELAKAALAKLNIEDGKVTSMTVHRKFSGIPADMQAALDRVHEQAGIAKTVDTENVPDGGLAVEIYVRSPRREAYVLADGDFKILRTNVL
jgi:hypothetical protein